MKSTRGFSTSAASGSQPYGPSLRSRGRYFCDLILDYLKARGEAQRPDFDRLLMGKLSDLLDDEQKRHRIKNLLQRLRREGLIEPDGRAQAARWRLARLDAIG